MKKTIIFAMVAIVAIAGSLTSCGKNVASFVELIVPRDTIYINDTVVTFEEYDVTDFTNTSMKMYQQTHTEGASVKPDIEIIYDTSYVNGHMVIHPLELTDTYKDQWKVYSFGGHGRMLIEPISLQLSKPLRLNESAVYGNETNNDIFIYRRKAPRMRM